VAVALIVGILSIVLTYALVETTQERKILRDQVAQLEQAVHSLETRSQALAVPKPAENLVPSVSDVEARPLSRSSSSAPGESVHAVDQAESSQTLRLKVENPRAILLDSGNGFRLEFKLSNLADATATGAMAVVASRKSSGQPSFVSSPRMELAVDGTPVNARQSVRFSIRHFRNMNGRFSFPYAQAESFRILIYSPSSQLVSDTLIPAAEVVAEGMGSPPVVLTSPSADDRRPADGSP
jgi:type II secretory pathway pseudopilin PulG